FGPRCPRRNPLGRGETPLHQMVAPVAILFFVGNVRQGRRRWGRTMSTADAEQFAPVRLPARLHTRQALLVQLKGIAAIVAEPEDHHRLGSSHGHGPQPQWMKVIGVTRRIGTSVVHHFYLPYESK